MTKIQSSLLCFGQLFVFIFITSCSLFELSEKRGMVKIEAQGKSFQMGTNKGKAFNQPVHTVELTRDYYMDKTEVTQKDYKTRMSNHYKDFTMPLLAKGQGDNFPVYLINWYDVVLYCNARSVQKKLDTVYRYAEILGIPGNNCRIKDLFITLSNNGYRLPTEAEWEFACRGGKTTDFYWGNINDSLFIDQYAWVKNNSNGTSHPVAKKTPNAYGLYDLCGNVYEWCHDWFAPYENSLQTNPRGPIKGTMSGKVIRGGSWYGPASSCMSASRFFIRHTHCDYVIGFRVILPIKY